MLKTINEKLVDNYLKDKPHLVTYVEELYKLLDKEVGRDWYLTVRELLVEKESFTILEILTGLVGEVTEEQINTLDQTIADCVSDVTGLMFETEGIVRVTYCALEDLETAYENETEETTTVLVDEF